MSALKYDVVTLGNHDFDIGIEGFMKHSNMPISNLSMPTMILVRPQWKKLYNLIKLFKKVLFKLEFSVSGSI